MKKIIISVAMLLSISLAVYGCNDKMESTSSSKKSVKSAVKESSEKKMTMEDFSALEMYDGALDIAREWQSDAELYLVWLSYEVDEENSSSQLIPDAIRYTFGSSKEKNGGLIVYTSAGSLTSEFDENLRLVDTLKPIKTDLWKIDNNEALKVSQESGGNDLLSSNSISGVSASLSQGAHFNWTIGYLPKDSGKGSRRFKINAESGELF